MVTCTDFVPKLLLNVLDLLVVVCVLLRRRLVDLLADLKICAAHLETCGYRKTVFKRWIVHLVATQVLDIVQDFEPVLLLHLFSTIGELPHTSLQKTRSFVGHLH